MSMQPPRRAGYRWLAGAVALIAASSLGACDGGSDTACTSDRECTASGRVCAPSLGICVECVSARDCLGEGEVCRANSCEAVTPCTTSRQCPGLVCDITRGFCVECVSDVDCAGEQQCDGDGFCQAPAPSCVSDRECSELGLVCDTASETCVECVRDADCVADRTCSADNVCRVGERDAGVDAGPGTDAGVDAGSDGGGTDAGVDRDAGVGADAGLGDAGLGDAGLSDDAGFEDDAGLDAGTDAGVDSGPSPMDGGPGDGGAFDGGSVDSGPAPDAAFVDGGPDPEVMLTGLGGPLGYGTEGVLLSDEGSSPAIPLTMAFPVGLNFYGTLYSTIYVNTNGHMTFLAPLTDYTPAVVAAGTTPLIAPYWGDVDTRAGGRPLHNNIHWFADSTRVVATWHRVGYYTMHTDLQNSFQAIITERSDVAPGDFDVEFRYERCEWTTGDANGGFDGLGGDEAQAGFVAGDGLTAVQLPGSGTPSVLDLCTTSNVGMPGIWRFSFRSGVPVP